MRVFSYAFCTLYAATNEHIHSCTKLLFGAFHILNIHIFSVYIVIPNDEKKVQASLYCCIIHRHIYGDALFNTLPETEKNIMH